MATEKQVEALSLDQLLEGTLDDLADAPEFKPFPVGIHKVKMNLEWKPGKSNDPKTGKPKSGGFMVMMEAIETMELADPEKDTPLVKGAKAGQYLNMGNEFGQGILKLILAAAAEKFGAQKNGELIKIINSGAQCLVITSVRADKENKQIVRTQIEEVNFDVDAAG